MSTEQTLFDLIPTGRLTCDAAGLHIPGCWNPQPAHLWRAAEGVTACVCGAQWWPGRVGTWHTGRDGGPYFMHADGCPDRVVPDEFALEADPGKCTASFPTFDDYDHARSVANGGWAKRPGLPPPRVIWRTAGGPWMDREPVPAFDHLCAVVEAATADEAWRVTA